MDKYYETEYAIKMLPLIITYCRDLQILYDEYIALRAISEKLNGLIVIDNTTKTSLKLKKNNISDEMILLSERVKRWQNELADLHISLCSIKLGRVNVPIFDDQTKMAISLCVHKDSNNKNLEWHLLEDGHEKAHPYWANFKQQNGLILPETV